MALFYAVHVYNLKPGVSEAEFERFMAEEWLPYVMKKKGCRGAMLLKGYTGDWTMPPSRSGRAPRPTAKLGVGQRKNGSPQRI